MEGGDGREDKGGGEDGVGEGLKKKRKFSPIRWDPDKRSPSVVVKGDRKGEEQAVQGKGSGTNFKQRGSQGPKLAASGGEVPRPEPGLKLGGGRGGGFDAAGVKVRIKRELGLSSKKAQSGSETGVDGGRMLYLPDTATRPDLDSGFKAATAGAVRGTSTGTSTGEAAELASSSHPSSLSDSGPHSAAEKQELNDSCSQGMDTRETGARQQPSSDQQDNRDPGSSGVEAKSGSGVKDSPALALQVLREKLLQSKKRRGPGETERGETRAGSLPRGDPPEADAASLEHRSRVQALEGSNSAVTLREVKAGAGRAQDAGIAGVAAEHAETDGATKRGSGPAGYSRGRPKEEAPEPRGEDEYEEELNRKERRDLEEEQQLRQGEEEGAKDREKKLRRDAARDEREKEDTGGGEAMDVDATDGEGGAERGGEEEESGERWAMEVEEAEMVEADERVLGIATARWGGGDGEAGVDEVKEERGGSGTSGSGSEDREGEEEGEGGGDESVESAGARNAMLRACRSVDAFERLNRIAEGTYGVVYRARDRRTGEIVALKKVKMDLEKEGFPLTSLREINLLLSLAHPNVVAVREVVVGSNVDSIFMVMEYMEHDLRSTLEAQKHAFSQSEVKCLMLQLLRGLHHLHSNWVLHRDLKSSNLLLNNRGQLKICDFGMAREFGSPLKAYSHMVVTLWYRAPELLLGVSKYSTAVDMWSAGCVMAELLSREPLFPGKTEIEQLDKIFKTLGTPTEKLWPEFSQLPNAKRVNFVRQPYNRLREKFPEVAFGARPALSEAGLDLLKRLLAYDPSKRISAAEALNHSWFREVPLPKAEELMPTFPASHEQDSRSRRRRAAQHSEDGPQQFIKDPAIRDDHGSMMGFFRQGKGP